MVQKFGTKQRDEDQQTEAAVYRMERRGLRLLPERLEEVEREVGPGACRAGGLVDGCWYAARRLDITDAGR